MQVLVVTCDRDRWQFQIQCWSFCKYLSSTTINIVVNEPDTDSWMTWFEQNCKNYLWRHHVCVYTRKDFSDLERIKLPDAMASGWKTQQLLKLLFSIKTDKKYVVLDTKNWLVNNTSIEDLHPHCRSTQVNPKDNFWQFVQECHRKFNLQGSQFYRPEHTPFWIDPQVTKSMFEFFGNSLNACVWFLKIELPSEFIIYDLYATSRGFDQPDTGTYQEYSKIYWIGSTPPTQEEIVQIVNNKNIKMFSIHLPVLKQMDHTMIENAVGFSTKYFYWRF